MSPIIFILLALVAGISAFAITARVLRIFTNYDSYFKTRIGLTLLLSMATGFIANLELESGFLSFPFQFTVLCFFWYFLLLILFSVFNRYLFRSELN